MTNTTGPNPPTPSNPQQNITDLVTETWALILVLWRFAKTTPPAQVISDYWRGFKAAITVSILTIVATLVVAAIHPKTAAVIGLILTIVALGWSLLWTNTLAYVIEQFGITFMRINEATKIANLVSGYTAALLFYYTLMLWVCRNWSDWVIALLVIGIYFLFSQFFGWVAVWTVRLFRILLGLLVIIMIIRIVAPETYKTSRMWIEQTTGIRLDRFKIRTEVMQKRNEKEKKLYENCATIAKDIANTGSASWMEDMYRCKQRLKFFQKHKRDMPAANFMLPRGHEVTVEVKPGIPSSPTVNGGNWKDYRCQHVDGWHGKTRHEFTLYGGHQVCYVPSGMWHTINACRNLTKEYYKKHCWSMEIKTKNRRRRRTCRRLEQRCTNAIKLLSQSTNAVRPTCAARNQLKTVVLSGGHYIWIPRETTLVDGTRLKATKPALFRCDATRRIKASEVKFP